jgi:hypothetical protein
MSYRLNLDISPKKAKKGSVQIFLNWTHWNGNLEPAMVFRKANGGRAVFILPMSYFHNVMQSSGYAMASIVAEAAHIAYQIGFDRMDRFAAKNVADCILDFTDDLFQMPPEPPTAYQLEQEQAGPRAELALRIGGETVLETEVAV